MTNYDADTGGTIFNEGECPWCGVTEGLCGNLLKTKPGESFKCWRFIQPVTVEAFEKEYGKEPPEEGDNHEQEEQE